MALPRVHVTGVCTGSDTFAPDESNNDEPRGIALQVRTDGGGPLRIAAWRRDFLDSELDALVGGPVDLIVEVGARSFLNKDNEPRGAVQATLVHINQMAAVVTV